MSFENVPDSIKARAEACKSPEELLALAKEEGYELSEEDLDAVSGGSSWYENDDGCKLCKCLCNDLYKR